MAALDAVSAQHAKHPLAVYARLVKGVNATREFKVITRKQTVQARQPDFTTGIAHLNAVVDASIAGKGLDNLSLNFALRTLADAQEATEGNAAAAATAKRMLDHFTRQKLNAKVLETIAEQAAMYQPGASYRAPAERRALVNRMDPTAS
jgi:hypothetical protein